MVVLGLAGVGAWLWLRVGLVLLQSYHLLPHCHGAMTLDRHVYLPSLTQSQSVCHDDSTKHIFVLPRQFRNLEQMQYALTELALGPMIS